MNRYFIGILLRGEVADWHIRTSLDISSKFNIWSLSEKVPPHITVYYPFETSDLEPVSNLLATEVLRKSPGDYGITDFDHFDDKVVFAKISPSASVREFVEQLQSKILQLPGLPPLQFPTWHPHATLAYKIEPEKVKEIWEYVLRLPKPNFSVPLDNVTIFRRDEDVWKVEHCYNFTW